MRKSYIILFGIKALCGMIMGKKEQMGTDFPVKLLITMKFKFYMTKNKKIRN